MPFVLLSIFLGCFYSHAGNGIERSERIDFTQSSEMSARAREKLVQFVEQRCQIESSDGLPLKARLMSLQRVRVDQGIIDETYRIIIRSELTAPQKQKAFRDLAEITITDYAGTNPSVEWVYIESVKNLENSFCQ
jgi:hypothetical protein